MEDIRAVLAELKRLTAPSREAPRGEEPRCMTASTQPDVGRVPRENNDKLTAGREHENVL